MEVRQWVHTKVSVSDQNTRIHQKQLYTQFADLTLLPSSSSQCNLPKPLNSAMPLPEVATDRRAEDLLQ